MATFAEAPPVDEKSGEKIFKTKCAQCHTVERVLDINKMVFPGLKKPQERADLIAFWKASTGSHLLNKGVERGCSKRQIPVRTFSSYLTRHNNRLLFGELPSSGDFLAAFGLGDLFSLSWNLDPAYTSRETLAQLQRWESGKRWTLGV